MKRPIVIAAMALGMLVTLGLTVWGGAVLYWHIRMNLGVRALIAHTKPPPDLSFAMCNTFPPTFKAPKEDLDLLYESGFRAVPYLIDSLEPSRTPPYLAAASDTILSILMERVPPKSSEPNYWMRRMASWEIFGSESPAVLAEKCRNFREWWSSEGRELYRWWKVWRIAEP